MREETAQKMADWIVTGALALLGVVGVTAALSGGDDDDPAPQDGGLSAATFREELAELRDRVSRQTEELQAVVDAKVGDRLEELRQADEEARRELRSAIVEDVRAELEAAGPKRLDLGPPEDPVADGGE